MNFSLPILNLISHQQLHSSRSTFLCWKPCPPSVPMTLVVFNHFHCILLSPSLYSAPSQFHFLGRRVVWAWYCRVMVQCVRPGLPGYLPQKPLCCTKQESQPLADLSLRVRELSMGRNTLVAFFEVILVISPSSYFGPSFLYDQQAFI